MNCHDVKTALVYQGARRIQPVKRLLACVCLWLACDGLATAADNPVFSEYQVKAAFLRDFTLFTDWPTNAFASTNAPIVIGIVGADPFGKTLDDLVKDDSVRGHPLVIKRLNSSDDLKGCQVLFICRNEKEQMSALLQKLKGSPVLTVGDNHGFAEQGGMVNFVLVEEKVKFEINPAVTKQAGLQISAKALRLAVRIVQHD